MTPRQQPDEFPAARPDRPLAEAAPKPPRAEETDAVCWCCGGQTVKRHCKIVCVNCGFMRDCSDP